MADNVLACHVVGEEKMSEQEKPTETTKKPKPDKKALKRLSGQQQKLLTGIIAGKSIKQAGEEARYSSKKSAQQALGYPSLRQHLLIELEEHGLTSSKIAEGIKNLTEANEELYDKTGKLIATPPALLVRLKAIELALKVRGDMTPVRETSDSKTQSHLHLHLEKVVSGDTMVTIDDAFRELTEELVANGGVGNVYNDGVGKVYSVKAADSESVKKADKLTDMPRPPQDEEPPSPESEEDP